jgi:hypothetical protein
MMRLRSWSSPQEIGQKADSGCRLNRYVHIVFFLGKSCST